MNTTKHVRTMRQIETHGRQLLALYPNATERDPVKLCKKLRRIEAAARTYTTDYCNGDIQPDADYANIDRLDALYIGKARAILGKGPAIVINHDPRGCALKIDAEVMAAGKLDIYRDMGGNGIICPTFDGE